jgi:hypothetical protein
MRNRRSRRDQIHPSSWTFKVGPLLRSQTDKFIVMLLGDVTRLVRQQKLDIVGRLLRASNPRDCIDDMVGFPVFCICFRFVKSQDHRLDTI